VVISLEILFSLLLFHLFDWQLAVNQSMAVLNVFNVRQT